MKLQVLLVLLFGQLVLAQYPYDVKIHSHNDYRQDQPFWTAYKHQARSIEIDVVLVRDTLFVSHHIDEISTERTIQNLYLEPLQKIVSEQPDSLQKVQVLIDIKSEAKPTLKRLIKVLLNYEVLVRNGNVSFVISGNRPPVEEYTNYPDYILFDYQSLSNIENVAVWKKVALISLPFYKYLDWDGKSPLTTLETEKINGTISEAHAYGKPFRFWATPDTELAWETFFENGIDFINTDDPARCYKFLGTIKKEHP